MARTSTGEYWVHILVNQGEANPDVSHYNSRSGQIVEARAVSPETGFIELPDLSAAGQFAVKISTKQAVSFFIMSLH